MTIRSGGRPRDVRAQQVRPYDPDAYATDTIPEFSEPVPGPRGGGGRGGHGIVGFLKFLVFALVLAAVVLAVALTALRPVVASTVMTIAEDNPAALTLPFVEGHRPREPGSRPDDPGLDRSRPGRVPGRVGRHGAEHRDTARGPGPAR